MNQPASSTTFLRPLMCSNQFGVEGEDFGNFCFRHEIYLGIDPHRPKGLSVATPVSDWIS